MPLLCFVLPILALSSPFVVTWNATLASQSIASVVIIAQTNVTIDWGDGSQNTAIVANATLTTPEHNYTTSGLFNVSIFGKFRWEGPASVYEPNLIDVVSWGDGFLVDAASTRLFAGYPNLRVSADPNTHPVFLPGASLDYMFAGTSFDSPLNWDLGNVSSLSYMLSSTPLNKPIAFTNTQGVRSLYFVFHNATKFNQPFDFDCTSVVDLRGMFYLAKAFDSPLNLMNTQQVTSTVAMFNFATSFNQPVILDTRSVTNMEIMFASASNFNQPVNFNTSKVQSLKSMFFKASSFNQPLSMDTSQVVSTDSMFSNAVSFAGPVSFTSLTRVTIMEFMFYGTALSQDLSGWNVSNATTSCAAFCQNCVLPAFPNCPNPCDPGIKFTNPLGQSVCFSRAPTTAAPSVPSTGTPSTAPSMAAAPSALSAASGAAEPLLLSGLFSLFFAVLF